MRGAARDSSRRAPRAKGGQGLIRPSWTPNLISLLRRFADHLVPVRTRAVGVAVLVTGGPLVSATLIWVVKTVIDDVFVGRRFSLFPVLGTAYLGGVAVKVGLDYVRQRLDAAVSERVVQDVRTELYRHLLSLSPGSLRTRKVGDLLAHLAGDVERVETLIYTAPLGLVADAAAALFFTGFLLLLSWKLTLLALLVVPMLVIAILRYAPRVKRAARITRRQASAWLSLAEETLGAGPLIHAFDAREYETARFTRRVDAARRAELRAVAVQAWLAVLVEGIAALGGLLVLAVGAAEIQRGAMTLGAVVAFIGSVGSLYEPIRGLGKASARFQRAAAGAQRVAVLLDTPSAVQERASATPLAAVRGQVEFRRVSFGYPDGPEVLHGVSLVIEPGEMIAVVGPTGSGKSTLMRLLLRLYDPVEGAVLIDGVDVRDVTLASLRQAIRVVLQEPYIFQGSVADNIRYGRRDASDDSVVTVSAAACVHGFVSVYRGGYATQVGPRGEHLSGGQRQRLALARALLRASPILILDEATASVDGETEELIQDAMDRLAGSRTIVVIAHRLSTVRRARRVIVLDEGRVIEDGTPQTLLREGTRFHELFAGQLTLARNEHEPFAAAYR